MSFPVFFQRYRNGELTNFNRSDLLAVLGPAAIMNGTALSAIRFSDRDGGEAYGAEDELFEQLSFDEGQGPKFFDALWRIANETQAFIYWLGDGSCSAVTDKAVLDQVPADVIADTGPVKVIKNGKALEKLLLDSDFGFD